MTTQEEIPRLAYSPREVAAMLGLDQQTIYRIIQSGKLPATQIGTRTYRILAADLDEYLAKNAVGDDDGDQPATPQDDDQEKGSHE